MSTATAATDELPSFVVEADAAFKQAEARWDSARKVIGTLNVDVLEGREIRTDVLRRRKFEAQKELAQAGLEFQSALTNRTEARRTWMSSRTSKDDVHWGQDSA